MPHVTGEAVSNKGERRVLLAEALQDALTKAPPPPHGVDIQHFNVLSIRLEHGGLIPATRTVVTIDVHSGPLPDHA